MDNEKARKVIKDIFTKTAQSGLYYEIHISRVSFAAREYMNSLPADEQVIFRIAAENYFNLKLDDESLAKIALSELETWRETDD